MNFKKIKMLSLILFSTTLLCSQDASAAKWKEKVQDLFGSSKPKRLKSVRHDINKVKSSIKRTTHRLKKAEKKEDIEKIRPLVKSLEYKENKLDKLIKKREHIKGRDRRHK